MKNRYLFNYVIHSTQGNNSSFVMGLAGSAQPLAITISNLLFFCFSRGGGNEQKRSWDDFNKLFLFIRKRLHLAHRLFARNFWSFLLSSFRPNSVRVTTFKRIKDRFGHAQLIYLFSCICRRIASFISLSASTRFI